MPICDSSPSSSSTVHYLAGALGAHAQYRQSVRFRSGVIGIIPARYVSSGFRGKPLVQILDKPMIQRTWERAKLAATLDHAVVATDDDKIAECCRGFGADVVMTSESCRNGTERYDEALQKIGKKYDIFVNIQGDEPLIEPEIIDGFVKALQSFDSKFLKIYAELPPTPLQLEEDLEQLKVHENGYKMQKLTMSPMGLMYQKMWRKIEHYIHERNLS